jgi:hypothetical protein
MATKFESAREAMDALDSLPESVDRLQGKADSETVGSIAAEAEAALEALKEHHAVDGEPVRDPVVTANGHRK